MSLDRGIPIVNLPNLYVDGLLLSINPAAQTTQILINPGQCRDQSNTYDLVLNDTISVNIGVSGIGGLDTGTIAADTHYAVYLISDPVSALPTAAILSTNYLTGPLMPFGYSAYRFIGSVLTDPGTTLHFFLMQGSGKARKVYYYIPVNVLTGGTSGGSNVSVAAAIPPSDIAEPPFYPMPILLRLTYTPFAAGNSAYVSAPFGSNMGAISGSVAGVTVHGTCEVVSAMLSGNPTIGYAVQSTSDSLTIDVYGYELGL